MQDGPKEGKSRGESVRVCMMRNEMQGCLTKMRLSAWANSNKIPTLSWRHSAKSHARFRRACRVGQREAAHGPSRSPLPSPLAPPSVVPLVARRYDLPSITGNWHIHVSCSASTAS